jgi:hypothetical protein
VDHVSDGRRHEGFDFGKPWVVAGEEEVVVGDVKAVLVDDGERVGTVDLRVDDGLEVSGSVIFRPEAEEFEARAGLGVVDDIKCLAFAVVLDA